VIVTRNHGIALGVCVAGITWCAACSQKTSSPGDTTAAQTASAEERPDVLPVMLNKDLPFRYPPVLYAEKTQGNVTLRLYIDSSGKVVNDSTHVAESSKVPTLDSAAIKGSRDLRFTPAKSNGVPMAVSILFPVYFRHPEAPPPPGDTVLKKIMPANGAASSPAAKANVSKKS
jgi:TonB family protein